MMATTSATANDSHASAIQQVAQFNKMEHIQWPELRQLIIEQLDNAISLFKTHDDAEPLVNGNEHDAEAAQVHSATEEPVQKHVERIRDALQSMDQPPFTVQRLCELVGQSSSQYKTVPKYLRAVEKVVAVTSGWSETLAPAEERETAAEALWYTRPPTPEVLFQVATSWSVPDGPSPAPEGFNAPSSSEPGNLPPTTVIMAADDQMDMFAPAATESMDWTT